MACITLNKIAYARSGDKGNHANIGVIAYTHEGYLFLKEKLSAEMVQNYFKLLGVKSTVRYELPNLLALNFVLHEVLGGGGSCSLRIDSQGKAFGQALLQMTLEVSDGIVVSLMKA
ncbi:MAG: hypothetical protein H0W50_05760 [Parachlamydiaceae bacterium]|nr:hypothetical protein [Parachlamydiaceae bacterium]